MTIFDRESLRHRVIADGSTMTPLSRRTFLAGALATGILSALPASRSAASDAGKRLVAGTRTLEVNGRAARVYSLIGPDGRPGIRLRAHERFRVDLANQSSKQTLVHWHGQLPPWTQDGFPWPETPPLANGAMQSYDYTPIPGTYWMHSHVGMQEQVLMTAPLIVEDEMAQREDRQEIVLMLHDFTFRSPEEVLASLTGSAHAVSAQHAAMTGMMDMGTMDMVGRDAPVMQMPGAEAPHMDLNDVEFDAFLANDRTLTDPEVARVERGGRVRLRIINGASSSQFWVDLGALTGKVVAVDGHSVRTVAGRRFPIAMGAAPRSVDRTPKKWSLSRTRTARRFATPHRNHPRRARFAHPALVRSGPARATRRPFAGDAARRRRAAPRASRGSCPHHLAWRQHEALCLVDGRRDVAARHAAHGKAGAARGV